MKVEEAQKGLEEEEREWEEEEKEEEHGKGLRL